MIRIVLGRLLVIEGFGPEAAEAVVEAAVMIQTWTLSLGTSMDLYPERLTSCCAQGSRSMTFGLWGPGHEIGLKISQNGWVKT